MDKPVLYRFKFDEKIGLFEAEAIQDYEEVIWYGKTEYRYKMNGSLRVVKADNIDKYIYEQVHSFNPSERHAREIIFDAISIKYLKANADAQKYRNLMEKISTRRRNDS
ncbi:MAG: hypothetical protein J5965_12230 [Aeriscardovia sp.]|nr:hypothetical protein [Aeriscardovia sp.]